MKIRLDVIDLDQDNPKQEDRIKRLTNSIKEVGQIDPVKLRIKESKNGKRRYDMVSGHHRYWALERLGRKTIDSEVEGMSEDTMDKHRSIAAAFDNREDPDIVTGMKMLNSLKGTLANDDDIKRFQAEYGYNKPKAQRFLSFARFCNEIVTKRQSDLDQSLEAITSVHFTESSALSSLPDERYSLLVEAGKNGWSTGVVKNKATAMMGAIQDAEEARQREELEIARRREMEAQAIKTTPSVKDSQGKLKTPERLTVDAETTVDKSRSKKILEESWDNKPSQKAVLDGLIAIKKDTAKWAETVKIGKFPPEASNKLNGLVDEAIESLEGFRKVLP